MPLLDKTLDESGLQKFPLMVAIFMTAAKIFIFDFNVSRRTRVKVTQPKKTEIVFFAAIHQYITRKVLQQMTIKIAKRILHVVFCNPQNFSAIQLAVDFIHNTRNHDPNKVCENHSYIFEINDQGILQRNPHLRNTVG